MQPGHERRKYLLRERGPDLDGHPLPAPLTLTGAADQRLLLLKFAGLGGYGQRTLARARRLFEAGFAPPVVGLIDGFLITRFLVGRPMTFDRITPMFLKTAARYLAFLYRLSPEVISDPPEVLLEMIRINTEEGLGRRCAERLRRSGLASAFEGKRQGAVDGRMLLHEWIALSGGGWMKTDGADHCADHFFPGCVDTAWDVAACLVEWNLSRRMGECLLGEYRRLSQDGTLERRLPFCRVAYLAHRLGYAQMAAAVLGEASPDGRKYRDMARRYAQRLKREINRL